MLGHESATVEKEATAILSGTTLDRDSALISAESRAGGGYVPDAMKAARM
jgi:hypothetical protein